MFAVMVLLYLLMGVINVKSLIKNQKILKGYILQAQQQGNANVMFPSLKMKLGIVSKFLWVVGVYFSIRVLFYALILFVDDDVSLWKFSTAVQTSDLITLGGILFLFRPRVWP